MRIGGTVILSEFKRGVRSLGFWFPWFIPTLFPGAAPGLPISYITYITVGFGFGMLEIMVGLRVPREMSWKNYGV